MATAGLAEGRLIPLLILDASKRPDVIELFAIQKSLPNGDVATQWGKARVLRDGVFLMLSFKRPAKVVLFLEFDIMTQGFLVDCILQSQCLYLQLGKPDDRLADTFESERILLEVPDVGFGLPWEKILLDRYKRLFVKKGTKPSQAQRIAGELITEWRKVNDIRMRSLLSGQDGIQQVP